MAEQVSDFNAINNYLLLCHLSNCRPQNYLYLMSLAKRTRQNVIEKSKSTINKFIQIKKELVSKISRNEQKLLDN